MKKKYDVIVVGGGHAGIEAALASRRIGCSVVLISAKKSRIGEMSCNPSIGGISKGTIVREIDAMDGSMGKTADSTKLQFRMLNRRKGPAVWGPRVQSDAAAYAKEQQKNLLRNEVDVIEDEVTELKGRTEIIEGVYCRGNGIVYGKAIVLATGTFLKGRLFRGKEIWKGGRIGDISADSLEKDIKKRMFHVKRFKTGTPVRVLRNTVNTSELELQVSQEKEFSFSYDDLQISSVVEDFYTTYTNRKTMEIVKEYLHLSPLIAGRIEGTGPRYCPSFEDKVVKFPDRKSQRIYVEPMGYKSRYFYLNGLSSSLPREAQEKMVHSLPGFENAVISDYGYAVEYSYFDYTEIDNTLKLRRSENLFAAGQICGTSGYEEAAGLGLIAGANAGRVANDLEPLSLSRMRSYIGVMIDDVIGKGADEPYRMFSSRAENRLHLRQDNADRRLFKTANRFGILSEEKKERILDSIKEADTIRNILEENSFEGIKLSKWCRRTGSDTRQIKDIIPQFNNVRESILRSVMLDEKYRGYIERNLRRFETRKKYGKIILSKIRTYMDIDEICWEARETLERKRPETLAEAAKIQGIRPTDLQGLIIYLSKKFHVEQQ